MTSPRPRRNPPAPPSSARRSTPKRAKGRPWPAEVRAEVLGRLEYGASLADEHKRTGVPKGTLSDWAKAAGIDLGAGARARTAAATERVVERVAEVKLTTVDRLERILELELDAHQQRAQLEHALGLELARALAGDLETHDGRPFRLQKGDDGARVMLRDPDSHLAQLVAAVELLGMTSPKRDNVGAWTRANHDLALLKGEATERGAVTVLFGIPRPDTSVEPVPQEELGR